MRVLLGPEPVGADAPADLAELYAVPRTPWLRANMLSTVDGSVTGSDGRSGSINNAADKRVFDTLRRLADAVLVGAGTARAERYRPAARPLVVLSHRGEVPPTLRGAEPGRVWLATHAAAPGLAAARDLLGAEQVLVSGEDGVDLAALRRDLHARGWQSLLCEGGPRLLAEALAQGVVDELDSTVVPRLVAGDGARLSVGAPVDVPLRLHLLVEDEGTLLARWLVS